MAECLAARLTAQEEQIQLLSQEIYNLRDGLSVNVDVEGVSPLLDSLRADNEKLRYRLVHLRRGLQAELRLQGLLPKTPQQVPKLKAPKTVASNLAKESDGGDNKVITKSLSSSYRGVASLTGPLGGNDVSSPGIAVRIMDMFRDSLDANIMTFDFYVFVVRRGPQTSKKQTRRRRRSSRRRDMLGGV